MATRQTTKASLLKTTSFALQSVDATKFYDATLQGNNLTATAHTSVSKINSNFTGDTLTARGAANTLTGGAGNDLLVSAGSNNLLVASAGADTLVSGANGATFQVANAAQLTASSISGGSGSDTLRIAAAAKLTDANFSRVRGTEVLSLTGASSVVLDVNALAAGINNVLGGTGNSTLSQEAGYTGAVTLSGNVGKDLFRVATGSQLAANSISGGAGVDTLVSVSNASLNDTAFAKVTGVEVLSLTGASAVTLGGNAGFSTVIAGSINQTSSSTASVRMVGSTLNDSFTVATAAQLAADTIVAGTGTDTLAVSQAATIGDAAFANKTGIEVLSLGGSSSVTLDKNASKAGINAVDAAAALDLSVTTGNTSKISITGSSSNDIFRMGDIKALGRNTITGGAGNDTLAIAGAGVIADSLFGAVRTVEALSLSGGNTVTLGQKASEAGLSTIFGGTGTLGNSFTQTTLSSGHQTIFGGAGADLFVVGHDSLLANDSLIGGEGTDTLKFLVGTTLPSGSMDNLSGIEVLQLSGISSLVSANVPTGLNTIYGGEGDSTYVVTNPGKLNITAGVGNDTFKLQGAGLLSDSLVAVTLAGGRGIDTLVVDGTLGVNDAFNNVTGVEVLSLNGASGVTLGGGSKTTGITQVFTDSLVGTTVVQTDEAIQSLQITAGAGNDLFSIANGVLLSKNTIVGGSGTNTLQVETASRLTDRSFANIEGTQILSLIDDGNYVELASLAGGTAEIATIVGAGSGNTINAANYRSDVLTFDLLASGGDNVVTGSSAEANLFLVADAALESTSIKGGVNADGDTLSLTFESDLEDAAFTKIRGVEVLELDGTGSVVLGTNAAAAGIRTVLGGTGDMIINRSAGSFAIEANALAKSNLYNYTSIAVAGADTITGSGNGNDTLQFEQAGNIEDAVFANKTGLQFVSLSGSSSVELGSNFEALAGENAEFTSLFGGSGSSTINQTAAAPIHIELSEGTGSYIELASDLLVDDTIVGAGSDTLSVSGEEVLDEAFTNVSEVSLLQLTGDTLGNASVTLEAEIAESGITTVIGSAGNMAFNLSSLPEGYVLDGRAGLSNLFSFTEEKITLTGAADTINSASEILAVNTVLGGEGVDTIFLASDDVISGADALGNISGIEVLSLTGSSEISLDSVAGGLGLASILGGDGDMKYTLDGGSYYIGSEGATTNLFVVSETTLLGTNTIVGAGGDDTLALGSDGAVTDDYFANLTGVSVLSLGAANEVTFGDFAAASGISTVTGGEGDVIAHLLAGTEGAYAFDASEATGTFLVQAADTDAMAASTFTGNADKSTLGFDEGWITDDAFEGVKEVGTVQLTGSSIIELGDNAAAISDTLSVSVIGGEGDNQFYQTNGSFLLDGSAGTSNLFQLDNASTLAAYDTIVGIGDGADTLALVNEDTLIADSVFSNISGVSVLSLSGSSKATLGSAAATTGITQVIAGDGDSVLNLATGAPEILLDGSVSTSLKVEIASAALAEATTLYGGEGADTLAFGAANTIADEAFTNVSGFEVLSVTGGSSVNLDAIASGAYLDTIYGGSGLNTITQGAENSNALYIDGGVGQLRVNLASSYYLVNDTILGGTSTLGNTLSVGGAGSILDSDFTNISRFGTLELEGGNNVALGLEAFEAGITRVIVEDGDNSFTVSADGPSGVTLDASAGTGDNSFTFENADQLATARIYGADGVDTLAFLNEAVISDTLLANADGIEALSLSGASDITLGTYADAMGLESVFGGADSTTFTQDSLSSTAYYLDARADEGNGSTFRMANAAQVADNTLFGGGGIDTLSLTSEDTIDDSDIASTFANITSVEVLELTGSSSVELGSYADQSSLMTVVGGSGNSTFTHGSGSEAAYYLDGGYSSSNLFSVADGLLASIDTYVGGSGTDTLQLGEDVIDDSAFANHSSIEVLQLTGSSELMLGASADSAGISTVIGGSGSNTITQTADNATSLYLDGSDATSNLFVIADGIELAGDTILGGVGSDTLQLEAEDVLGDEAFTNHRDIEIVQLTGSGDITLGEKADFAGITTVIGGTGNSIFTQLERNYSSLYLDGSESGTSYFALNDGGQLAANTLVGGEGNDTLQITTAETVLDTDFTNTTSVEVLRLTGSSDVTIGEKADFAGIATVIGGSGTSTITHADRNYNALYLDGSNGSTNLFVINDETELALDTIIGGAGNDTLQLATGVRFEDATLDSVSLVEVLQLSGTSDVTLGSAAASAGISTVYGGSGATSLDASAMTGALVIDAGSGSGASFLKAGSGADNITGGSGADTLTGWASDANTATDTLFGGAGADLFVLGDEAGNGYGDGASTAIISDFTGGTDALQLHDYGTGATSYRVDANAGSGYTHQLFDTNSGSDVLLANINYAGSDVSGDLLGAKAIFA
jgi:hypothetical protein